MDTARPDFTGVWNFNRERSSLQITPPDSTTFVIEHHEPQFHLERTHTAGTTSDFFAVDLVTDGRTTEFTHAGMKLKGRLSWESDALVFYSEISREGMSGTNIVRYRLTDSGRTLTALELMSFAGEAHENHWVLDRR